MVATGRSAPVTVVTTRLKTARTGSPRAAPASTTAGIVLLPATSPVGAALPGERGAGAAAADRVGVDGQQDQVGQRVGGGEARVGPGDQPAPGPDGQLEQAAGEGQPPGRRAGPGGQGQPRGRPGQGPRRLPGQRSGVGAPYLGQVLGQPLPQVAEPPVHAHRGQVGGQAHVQAVAGRLEPACQGDVLDQRPGHGREPAHGVVGVPPDQQALPGQEGVRPTRVGDGVQVQPLRHGQAQVGQEQLLPPAPGRLPGQRAGRRRPGGQAPPQQPRQRLGGQDHVGVDERQPPPGRGQARPVGARRRLPGDPGSRSRDRLDPRPSPRRLGGGPVARPVVRHHHLDHGRVLGQQRPHTLPHPPLLIPRRHHHAHRLPEHPRIPRPQPVPPPPSPPQPGKAVRPGGQPRHPGQGGKDVPAGRDPRGCGQPEALLFAVGYAPPPGDPATGSGG